MAEEKGFEPLRRLRDLLVFKTSPFNRTWVFLQDCYHQQQIDYSTINLAKSIKNFLFYHIYLINNKYIIFFENYSKFSCNVQKNALYLNSLKKDSACPSGGIGRRTGLKILRDLTLVPVQVRPWAP